MLLFELVGDHDRIHKWRHQRRIVYIESEFWTS